MTSMDAQSSSSSSSSRSTPSSPSRSRSLMVLKTLAVFALAASLVANVEAGAARALFPARSQIPFEATGAGAGASSAAASYDEASSAAASSPSSSDVSLHRLCLPPSKAEDHWPSILTSLWALHSRHPTFDMDVWSSPRLVRHDTSEDEGGDIPALIEESSCIDFTYSSDPRAIRLLDELVHGVDRAAEVDWIILADEEEMRRRVAAQKESGIAAAAKASSSSPSAKLEDDPFHAAYHRLQNITAFLSYQVSQHPNLAELVDLGTSYEGRVIQGIRLHQRHAQDGDDDGGDEKRREIVIAAGAHGREWITTSTALYLVSAFLSRPSYLRTFSVVIIPVLNPDGFEYTWTTDRFFRKNRQLVSGHDWWGRKCYGVDVSRNFPANFRKPSWGANPCSPTHPGDGPLSSPEAAALATHLNASRTIAFVDLHSYGQLILHPWLSCTPAVGDVPDEEDLSELAIGASRAAKSVHGKSYRVGRGCEAMYNQDGSAVDFAYHDAKVKYSFEFELRDEGSYGFTLPADQIRPTAEEVWSGIEYLLKFVKGREKLR